MDEEVRALPKGDQVVGRHRVPRVRDFPSTPPCQGDSVGIGAVSYRDGLHSLQSKPFIEASFSRGVECGIEVEETRGWDEFVQMPKRLKASTVQEEPRLDLMRSDQK